jgi:hypothetical protein
LSLDMVPYRDHLLLTGQADPGDRIRHRHQYARPLQPGMAVAVTSRRPRLRLAAAADGRLGRLEQAHNQAGTSDAWQLGVRCFVRVFGNAAVARRRLPGA